MCSLTFRLQDQLRIKAFKTSMKIYDSSHFYLHFAQNVIRFVQYCIFCHLTESSKRFSWTCKLQTLLFEGNTAPCDEDLTEVYPFRVLMSSRGLLVTTNNNSHYWNQNIPEPEDCVFYIFPLI